MKLYISYYDNYAVMVEGTYNTKKDKFIIKSSTFLCAEDIKIDNNDKYGLLREILKLNHSKVKNVVFSLNTKDVIIKSNSMSKINPKDLDGIMNNEIYEMMSLSEVQYTFSYEVMNERIENEKEVLDIVTAAISNEEIDKILEVFKEFKLNVERVDTMSTAYGRLLKDIEYEDIMILNSGTYGSIVNIYKENNLFIYDNIPVKINENSNFHTSLALVDEVKGLTNFYASRNFGKSIDTIVIVGEGNKNKYIKESIKESFNSELIIGIENLFDIEEDIEGDLQKEEISKVSDILGSMLITTDKYGYSYMNLLPSYKKNSLKQQDKIKRGALIGIGTAIVLSSPYFIFGIMEKNINDDVVLAQVRLEDIKLQHKDIESVDEKIKSAEEEIAIYDMLSSKSPKWGNILSSIDKNIPYKLDLTSIEVSYDSELIEAKTKEEPNQTEEKQNNENQQNNNEENQNNEETEKEETPIYENIPNVITIKGIAKTPSRVGQFVYSLNKVDYFKSVDLKNSTEDKENGGYTFEMVLVLREGAVSGE